jgi:spoIIIJ-associated protein
MEMKRIEAETLEEAYSKAAKELSCSVTEINYEIIQHPSVGVMGLFKKSAIIIAVKKIVDTSVDSNGKDKKDEEKRESIISKNSSITVRPKKSDKADSGSQPTLKQEEVENSLQTEKSVESNFNKISTVIDDKDAIVDGFFNDEKAVESKSTVVAKAQKSKDLQDDLTLPTELLEFDDDRDSPENRERSIEIENKLKKLIEAGCFEIDTVEVDVFNGIAHIFVDGEDAALLIGKEGYRYNALSYMLFNWINSVYDLYIKLEIAEFIQTQEEMIDNYLKPIAEHIIAHGRGKTKPLDGILVQIALEKLRAMFPNKYIAIKTGKDGKKFILINNFNSQKPN